MFDVKHWPFNVKTRYITRMTTTTDDNDEDEWRKFIEDISINGNQGSLKRIDLFN